MRPAVVLALAAALALPASAVSIDGPGVVNFPNAPILPRQDQTARGYLSPAISTLHTPSFCWELSLFTRSQPLFAYFRRAGTGRLSPPSTPTTTMFRRCLGPVAAPTAAVSSSCV